MARIFTCLVELDSGEVEATYAVDTYYPATYWQPAEGGEVEVLKILRDGKSVSLSAEDEVYVREMCEANVGDDLAEEAGDFGDYAYECHRERIGNDW